MTNDIPVEVVRAFTTIDGQLGTPVHVLAEATGAAAVRITAKLGRNLEILRREGGQWAVGAG